MPRKQPPIHFHYLTEPFHFPHRTFIKSFISRLFYDYSKEVQNVNYIFCSDDYLLNLNKEYLQHDYYTDIITFELSPPRQPIISDIYISIDRVRENAKQYSSSLYREIIRLIIHGALHLCGQKDKTEEDSKRMRKLEELYLDKWFHVKRTSK